MYNLYIDEMRSKARLTLARFCGMHWYNLSRANVQTSRKVA